MTASSATDDETDEAKVAEVDVEAAVVATGMASSEGGKAPPGAPPSAVWVLGETGGEIRSALVRPARGWSLDIRRPSPLPGEAWPPSKLSSSSLRSGSTETVASLALLCLR